MSKSTDVTLGVLFTVVFVSLQVIVATWLWNNFAPMALGLPKATNLQMLYATLFYFTFTGKLWAFIAKRQKAKQ